jgi:uncharacterized membrane protein
VKKIGRRRSMLTAEDEARIVAAIRAAELRTSGELVVSFAPPFRGDVRGAAERAFKRLGMTRTSRRNGVLFFVVPSRRRFVVLGDVAIHERVGQRFWENIAGAMSDRFRDEDFVGGLLRGIAVAADALAAHFPPVFPDRNELVDHIDVS